VLKPRKIRTLFNPINSLFKRNLAEVELDGLIKELKRRKIVLISNKTNVSYKNSMSLLYALTEQP